MAFPTTFLEKKHASYVSISNAIASESNETPKHAARMSLARQMSSLNPSFDAYITIDLLSQGFDDTTPVADIANRLSGLITNLIKLGFGD